MAPSSPASGTSPQHTTTHKWSHTTCRRSARKVRVLGPFPICSLGLYISRFGVIPKHPQPGKWRLMVDLSAPKVHSINYSIADNLCSLKYPSIDTAIKLVLSVGPGACLSKLDIKEAYQMMPVHPEDWSLLGMRWHRAYYVDTCLSVRPPIGP